PRPSSRTSCSAASRTTRCPRCCSHSRPAPCRSTGGRPRAGWLVGAAFVALLVVTLPLGLPVLPLRTADRLGVVDARSDYQDEVGWHALAHRVDGLARGTDVVVTLNYGEAGALELFGRGLPPTASGDVTFRYWRPNVEGRRALLV